MEFKIKIIIIGEPGVGKTSLVKMFVSHNFTNDYKASIGSNIFIKEIQSFDKNKIRIQLWDIAGQEKWTKMRHIYYKGTDGALIVIDLARKKTLEQVEKFWYPDLIKNCGGIPIILIANKNDLKKEINKKDIEKVVSLLKIDYNISTSAKTGSNVEQAFNLISKKIIQKLNK